MYCLTGNPIWQEKGWKMFQAIMKHTRTPIANARISDVTHANPKQDDSMESFWLAETLKYLYLLFSEPDLVSLDNFVL
jgi:mannosyl-oligosaccharide alpha-1,2-mannosidase